MESEIIFQEKQRFTQWWVWVIVLGVDILFFVGFFKQVIGGQPFGDNPMSNEGLGVAIISATIFTLVFYSIHLDTRLTKDGIYFKLFPFHLKFKYFPWNAMTKFYVREYSPLAEYGGWGIKFGRNGIAYNISGNRGLQLEFLDNKNILVGTNKPDEMNAAIQKITV